MNKVLNVNAFVFNIAKTGLFRGYMVDIVALYALVSELLCIILLAIKERIGVFVSLVIVLSYTVYLSYLGFSNTYEECGCGGILNSLPFNWHLFINSFLVLILLYLNSNNENA